MKTNKIIILMNIFILHSFYILSFSYFNHNFKYFIAIEGIIIIILLLFNTFINQSFSVLITKTQTFCDYLFILHQCFYSFN